MSVINSMLRDLEQRRESGEVSDSDEDGTLRDGVVVTRLTRRSPFGTLARVLVVLLLGLMLWFVASSQMGKGAIYQLGQLLSSQPLESGSGRLQEGDSGGSESATAPVEPVTAEPMESAPAATETETVAPSPSPSPTDDAAPVVSGGEIAAPAAVEAEPPLERAAAAVDPSLPDPPSSVEDRSVILLHDLVPIRIPVGPAGAPLPLRQQKRSIRHPQRRLHNPSPHPQRSLHHPPFRSAQRCTRWRSPPPRRSWRSRPMARRSMR